MTRATRRNTGKSHHSSVRHAAVQVLVGLEAGQGSLATLLPRWSAQVPAADQALLQEMCYGVCRWSVALSAMVEQLLSRPLRKRERAVYWLLQLGLYQLRHMRIAQHAALDQTVSVAAELKKGWARGLVNAVLRNYLRQQYDIEKNLDRHQQLAMPAWLYTRFENDWPESVDAICERLNQHPPMTLRVNTALHSAPDYLSLLQAEGIAARALPLVDSALTLERAMAVDQLPGFADGRVCVQDAAAQLAATVLQPAQGAHVLDACAAPGGKTQHLLERNPSISLDAVDVDADRLKRVEENLHRWHRANDGRVQTAKVRLFARDVADVSWWDGRHYDAILLDAPCSGTGVIRRHPDIKLLRRESDIEGLRHLQQQILQALWPLLRPGGHLLYVTCSILSTENEMQIRQFVDSTADCESCELRDESGSPVTWGESTGHGRQLLPGEDHDGFYYCLLMRVA